MDDDSELVHILTAQYLRLSVNRTPTVYAVGQTLGLRVYNERWGQILIAVRDNVHNNKITDNPTNTKENHCEQ